MIAISVKEPRVLEVIADERPVVDAGQVLIKVATAGICGTDVHIFHGDNPFARYPLVIGHEIAGTIEEVGGNVTSLKVGQKVVIDPAVSCGSCYACRIGRGNVCANLEVLGVHRAGGFRSYFAVPAGNVVPVSSDLPWKIAALAEPFSIAANILNLTGCTADDTVLVYGAGPIGLTVLQVAKMKGARCLVADIEPGRLDIAAEFGAEVLIDAGRQSVRDAVAHENGSLGPTLIIDAAGVPDLLGEAAAIVSPAGRIGLGSEQIKSAFAVS